MSREVYALGALIQSAPVRRAGRREYPVLSMTMRDGLVDQAAKFKKRIASFDTSQYKVAARGQLVVGFPIDEGVLAFQTRYDEAIVSPAYDIWTIRPNAAVDLGYLERYLRSPRALAFYSAKLQGTTARRRTIPDDVFLSLPVPLPPLPEQRRIAAILDHADALRAKRIAANTTLKSLLHSAFVEMFGDPISAPRGAHAVMSVGAFVREFESGKSIVAADEEDEFSEFRVLKISSVTSGYFDPGESKALPAGYAPPKSHFVRPGDLLFSRANTADLIGATAYIFDTPENLVLPDKLWRFSWRPDFRIEPLFVWHLFMHPATRRALGQLATGTSGSMKNISQEKVKSMRIAIPPHAEQLRFADFVRKAKLLSDRLADSSAKYERLHQELRHSVFTLHPVDG